MADSTTNRPRPRPRPRPVAKRADNDASTSNPSFSSVSSIEVSAGGARRIIEVHDTDEMFIRNRNRTSKTWQKMEEANREPVKPAEEPSPDSDQDQSPRTAANKRKKETHKVPIWQKSKDLTRMLSEGLLDGSDSDDVEVIAELSTPKGKRKRKQRSRSRSITPPPALPEQQLQNAKNIVRQTLRGPVRPPSPTFLDPDESGDTIIFQSELNEIAQEVAANANRASSQAPVDGPEDHIIVVVKWQPHPLDPKAMSAEWQYKLNRNDNFRDLFEAAAEDACIQNVNLIMTYQGKRFFPSVTPHTLNIWGDTAELVAYEKRAFEYIQQNPTAILHASSASQNARPTNAGGAVVIEPSTDNGDDAATPPAETQESEAESEAEGDTFKLVLRSSGNRDITLTVRPTTKCGAIIKAFLKKLGIADQYPGLFSDTPANVKKGRKSKADTVAGAKDPRLCIDGDKMGNETEIGDADLEDGDMVEVVGM